MPPGAPARYANGSLLAARSPSVAARTPLGPMGRLHPCLLQRHSKRCDHTPCPYREMPAELCLDHLRTGECPHPSTCPWVHEDATIYLPKGVSSSGTVSHELSLLNHLASRPGGSDTVYLAAVTLEVPREVLLDAAAAHPSLLRLDGDTISWAVPRTPSTLQQNPSVAAVYHTALDAARDWGASCLSATLRRSLETVAACTSILRRRSP